ncbi:Ig-like domain repeat protein [Dokdonella fugitiva]|jgi:hypothetical protein|uniref:Putative repeat protein (TIGR01451 family) n=1 Tax=Dokdonella fugitiva TaxID=328517 RepID=A0A4R2IC57_9GAMM|nr:Ig-like domain repeat protein [Dokdonella fugitiva]MBA8885033.1 hypothetical protein [Dokdonella fugitiva]TCO42131.1 putative repeat protein (TIGR01451 family) [Dokdonella fugitiva]
MPSRKPAARLRRKPLSVLVERLLWSSAAALAVPAALPTPAQAATITVTSTADPGNPGTCTLRQAIVSTNTGSVAGTACANSGSPGFGVDDTIRFDASLFSAGNATITLADLPDNYLHVASNGIVTIDAGTGRNVTVQRPANAQNKFPILFGEALQNGNITMRLYGMTLRNGYLDDTRGALNGKLNKYSFGGFNSAGAGVGVIYGHLTLDRCTIADNTVHSPAGGAKGAGVMAGNNLTIRSSIISGNEAKGPGSMAAGVYSQLGTVSIIDSIISGNVVQGPMGGGAAGIGIMLVPFTAITTSKLNIVNSTVSGNRAPNAEGWGAAISAPFAARVTIANSTFACNDAPAGSAAIHVLTMPTSTDFSVSSTIFADTPNALCPAQGTSREIEVVGSGPGHVQGDHNLLVTPGAIDATMPFPADTAFGDPQLGPLQSLGGRTQVHPIATTSPARNTGSNPHALARDQRGADFSRSVGSAPDIGAFELQQAGLCGSAQGGSFASLTASSPNLCSSGATLQGFFGSGPWSWFCALPSDPLNNEFCGAKVLASATLLLQEANGQPLAHVPVYGEPLRLRARLTGPVSPPPGGKVTFVDATDGGFAPLCADRTLDTGSGTEGQADCVPGTGGAPYLRAGQRQFRVTYVGDSRYGATQSALQSLTVLPATSVTTLAPQPPGTLGEPFTVAADVSLAAPSEAPPSGVVEIHDLADDTTCVYSLDGAQPGCPLTPASAGVHPLQVTFHGGSDMLSSSASGSRTIARAPTQASVTLAPPAIVFGEAATAMIDIATSVDPQLAVPGGTVEVGDGAGASCTIVLPATDCTLVPTSGGTHAFTASYAGDGNFAASASAPAALQVAQAPTMTAVSLSADTIEFGASVLVTASIASDVPAALALPGGSITVGDGDDGAGDSCTIVLPSTSCELTPTSAGQKTVTASYAGDAGFAGSSGSVALVVLEAPAQLALTIDDGRDHARYGEALTYTIVLTNSGNGPATDIGISGVPGAAFDGATLAWTCVADSGATCTASGGGTTLADTVTLPPGSSLTWSVDVTVPQQATGPAAVFSASALDANASDSDVLVLFRDGFES